MAALRRQDRDRGPLAQAGLQVLLGLEEPDTKGGRPVVDPEVRDLIRRMSRCQSVVGQLPGFTAELLKLGIDVSQTTVAKYMIHHARPSSPGWRTFLDNHLNEPDLHRLLYRGHRYRFRILFVFLVLSHDRRRVSCTAT